MPSPLLADLAAGSHLPGGCQRRGHRPLPAPVPTSILRGWWGSLPMFQTHGTRPGTPGKGQAWGTGLLTSPGASQEWCCPRGCWEPPSPGNPQGRQCLDRGRRKDRIPSQTEREPRASDQEARWRSWGPPFRPHRSYRGRHPEPFSSLPISELPCMREPARVSAGHGSLFPLARTHIGGPGQPVAPGRWPGTSLFGGSPP